MVPCVSIIIEIIAEAGNQFAILAREFDFNILKHSVRDNSFIANDDVKTVRHLLIWRLIAEGWVAFQEDHIALMELSSNRTTP